MNEFELSHPLNSQLLAALHMLKDCIDRCPDSEWYEAHDDYPFARVLFHALFDCDYHLSGSDAEFMAQKFHSDNRGFFGEYEELEEKSPVQMHGREFIISYYEHCRNKAEFSLSGTSGNDMLIPDSDIRGNMTRLERHINLIRHMQHHASQLGLRLQFLTGKEMQWSSRGYE